MGIIIALIFAVIFIILALSVIFALNRPGSRYRLKRDYHLTDREIDEKFGDTVQKEDLDALEREKQKKNRVA